MKRPDVIIELATTACLRIENPASPGGEIFRLANDPRSRYNWISTRETERWL
jgi:hypothetical protein